MKGLLALAAAYAALMLWRYGRRAILFAAPGLLRFSWRPSAAPATPAQRQCGDELAALGFTRLGARSEDGPLGGLGQSADAWASEALGTYADALEERPRPGAPPRVSFLSAFPDGAAALTVNFARQPRSAERVEAGGMPGADVASTLAAHRRTLDRMARHGQPRASADRPGRDAAARAWYRAAGASELRGRFLAHFVNALLAALILAGALRILVSGSRVP
ncbi:MAG TPA: hypothetical protein VMT17_15385 [Anaeromyxobacteraceae bacterium]|nr:hypothetical protein [Anaeromyxobacteraceae bacterium]